jgi:hypothetical protein
MEKDRISFRPLHDGMGFHPFSDGLPYAPEAKRKQAPSTGTGAVSAGTPRFAEPVRTARQLQQASQARTQPAPAPRPVVTRPQPQTQPVTSEGTGSDLVRRRAFAYLLDAILHAGFWITTNLAALFAFQFHLDPELMLQNPAGFLVFFLLSQWLFVTLQEVLFETSAGKVFFQLEFERGHRSLLLRSIVFALGSLLVFGWFFRPQDSLGKLRLRQGVGRS